MLRFCTARSFLEVLPSLKFSTRGGRRRRAVLDGDEDLGPEFDVGSGFASDYGADALVEADDAFGNPVRFVVEHVLLLAVDDGNGLKQLLSPPQQGASFGVRERSSTMRRSCPTHRSCLPAQEASAAKLPLLGTATLRRFVSVVARLGHVESGQRFQGFPDDVYDPFEVL